MSKTTLKPAARHAFNWGFHDGADAAIKKRSPEWQKGAHPWPAYEAGYWNGHALATAGGYSNYTTSDDAWEAYQRALRGAFKLSELSPGVFTSEPAGAMIIGGAGRFIRTEKGA